MSVQFAPVRTYRSIFVLTVALLAMTACGADGGLPPDVTSDPSSEPVAVTVTLASDPDLEPVVTTTIPIGLASEDSVATSTSITTTAPTTTTTTTTTTAPPPVIESEEPEDHFITYQPNA